MASVIGNNHFPCAREVRSARARQRLFLSTAAALARHQSPRVIAGHRLISQVLRPPRLKLSGADRRWRHRLPPIAGAGIHHADHRVILLSYSPRNILRS